MNSLCDRLEFYAFQAGDVIIRQGEEGDHLFISEAPTQKPWLTGALERLPRHLRRTYVRIISGPWELMGCGVPPRRPFQKGVVQDAGQSIANEVTLNSSSS